MRWWAPRSVRRCWPGGRASWFGRVVDELIDTFVDAGHAELVRQFTFQFPAQVIGGVLGLPREDFPQFQVWASAIISVNSAWEPGIAASVALKEYLAGVLEERRAHPRADLVSDLAVAELDGERLDDEEIFSFLRLLLPAGVETTFRSSGNFIYALLTHPDQLDALRLDRSLMPQAIEEALRWEPPLLITSRVVTRDTELRGISVPAGANVTVMLGAANRDPAGITTPTASTSSATRSSTSRSATVRTCAWACIWLAWRPASQSTRCSTGSPTCASTPKATIRTSTARSSAPPPRLPALFG